PRTRSRRAPAGGADAAGRGDVGASTPFRCATGLRYVPLPLPRKPPPREQPTGARRTAAQLVFSDESVGQTPSTTSSLKPAVRLRVCASGLYPTPWTVNRRRQTNAPFVST